MPSCFFDEAVYSKIQHVRWKERIFYDKFVVRLGEFHTIMSFLSAGSKIFEDRGLKVMFVFTLINLSIKQGDIPYS